MSVFGLQEEFEFANHVATSKVQIVQSQFQLNEQAASRPTHKLDWVEVRSSAILSLFIFSVFLCFFFFFFPFFAAKSKYRGGRVFFDILSFSVIPLDPDSPSELSRKYMDM